MPIKVRSGGYLRGFTLIEILLVVALIAILATVTIVAINPARNMANTRNAERSSEVGQILNAVSQYLTEEGHTVSGLGTIATCPAVTNIGSGTGNVNLAAVLVPVYIPAIPTDPVGGTAENTGYTICVSAENRFTVAAPGAEGGKTISVQR